MIRALLYWPRAWLFSLWEYLQPEYHATVDENEKCPACGHRCGKIRFAGKADLEKRGLQQDAGIIHTCLVCGAESVEPTVRKAAKWIKS